MAKLDVTILMNMEDGWRSRGYLPHLHVDGATQFLTWRVDGCLPAHILEGIHADSKQLPDQEQSFYVRRSVEEFLDQHCKGHILDNPVAARTVVEVLRRGEPSQYEILAFSVLPNHCHAVLRLAEGTSMSTIMQSIKSISSHQINKLLGRKGRLWQPEYFDRLIRNEEHLARTVEYVEYNPVKAGLCLVAEDWPYSSAYRRSQ